MKDFRGKLAIVSGGGYGMGRQLVVQLAEQGCSVAFCDVVDSNSAETLRLATAAAAPGVKVTAHRADVSKEEDWERFRDEVVLRHGRKDVNLLFNNAGVGAGGSFLVGSREEWEKCFAICWYGVYYGCRVFMPLLVASKEGWVVNTSSVNGFWASLGPNTPHVSYSASKFAVKGFTEALITDCKVNAPHVGVSLVMPGFVGTGIVANSAKIVGLEGNSDDTAKAFETAAPTTAAQAAKVILDGVKAGKWRILIGDDARWIDEAVRADPENAYDRAFYRRMIGAGNLASAPKLKM
ncbi:short-chain alcohol dehydrogenase [Hyaloraphidium curvatum]|nr:short-chain alcohol dehydrogenase [Hyaloraphidium curvatum]